MLAADEESDQDSCEVNGKIYQDGEVFQPSCKLQCRCSGGGFICVPLCSEDVRLPTPDCPYPRRVEIPGKCCQEWICDREPRQILQDNLAGTIHRSQHSFSVYFYWLTHSKPWWLEPCAWNFIQMNREPLNMPVFSVRSC